jgi:hypothetical protein
MKSTITRALVIYLAWFVLAIPTLANEPCVALAADRISWSGYATALKAYVDDRGLVDYSGLRAHTRDLDELATAVGTLPFPVYEGWKRAEQLSFWVNAYNAFVLKTAVEHYPEEGAMPAGGRSPGSGITADYSRPWDRIRFMVYTLPMTLESIRNDELPRFKEPRVYLALVPGTMGGPPLRREPYDPARLDEQLDDQARRFLSDPTKFRIDRSASRVYLSSLFQWYGPDFVTKHRPATLVPNKSAEESSVINFIGKYVAPEDREYLEKGEYVTSYVSYDWSLNDKK